MKIGFLYFFFLILPFGLLANSSKEASIDPTLRRTRVIFLLGADCPITRQYAPVIREWVEKWRPEGLTKVSVRFCNLPQNAGQRQARAFMHEHQLHLPWHKDPSNRFAHKMGVKAVPEVLVYHSRKLVYSGAIDNMFAGLGQRRAFTTEHYLQDAIESCRAGRLPSPARRTAYGCHLE